MVGCNVAMTYLVAERVVYERSNLVYFTFAIMLLLMNMMNMSNSCMNACCFRCV